ncbi:DUF4124 domain-containing protein [Halioxenophilus sp. WMMB6]|uniref:DUF4124 domain-containing protein n=1 Tax=Halioxenophilus sp. WMMB6 TaxID=3073815 RepID=UPI00295EA41D|nr:DUF4124 domain-containing protein [Halioxenophilus sp. WMMB6]
MTRFALRLTTCTCLTLLLAWTNQGYSQSTVYKHVDEAGNVLYSDSPQSSDDEPVALPPINTQPAPSVSSTSSRKAVNEQPEYILEISHPKHDTTITPGQTEVMVSGHLSPGAREPLHFELLLDGDSYSQNSSPSFLISPIYRGTHTLTIRALDEYGDTVVTSESIQIHVIRPTVSN